MNDAHNCRATVFGVRRAKSPLPTVGAYEAALESPLNTLPHTEFPLLNASGGYVAPYRPDSAGGNSSSCFSPMPTRDHQQEVAEETASIINQVSDSFAPRKNAYIAFAIDRRNHVDNSCRHSKINVYKYIYEQLAVASEWIIAKTCKTRIARPMVCIHKFAAFRATCD